jgi:hypothetical protein
VEAELIRRSWYLYIQLRWLCRGLIFDGEIGWTLQGYTTQRNAIHRILEARHLTWAGCVSKCGGCVIVLYICERTITKQGTSKKKFHIHRERNGWLGRKSQRNKSVIFCNSLFCIQANLLASNLLYAQEQDGMRMFSPCLVNPQTNAEGLAMSLNIELRCDYGFYRDA